MQLKISRAQHCIVSLLAVHCWADPIEHELTKTDIFSTADWDSSKVEIQEIHIGMSREDTNITIHKRGLQLVEHGVQYVLLPCSKAQWCEVYDSRNYYTGLKARFGKVGNVIQIVVQPAPDDADPAVKRVNVIRSFKGQTYQFFNVEYSNELRLRLFGLETSAEKIGGRFGNKIKDTQYLYPNRGIAITVSPEAATSPKDELIEVIFYEPKRN